MSLATAGFSATTATLPRTLVPGSVTAASSNRIVSSPVPDRPEETDPLPGIGPHAHRRKASQQTRRCRTLQWRTMPAVFYLRYNREADKVARLTSITGDLEILSKRGSEEAKAAKIVGWYSYADERLVCLCRLDGVPWLRVDDFAIPVDDDVHVFWDLVGPRQEAGLHAGPPPKPWKATVNPAFRGTLRVEKAQKVIFSFDYFPFQEMAIL